MLITSIDPKYKAQYIGTKLHCYCDEQLMATIKVRSILEARTTINDWARLKISIEDVVYFQQVAKEYVGCTVDDIKYAEDGKTIFINGKQLEQI